MSEERNASVLSDLKEGIPKAEIAKKLGISTTRIIQIEKQALRRAEFLKRSGFPPEMSVRVANILFSEFGNFEIAVAEYKQRGNDRFLEIANLGNSGLDEFKRHIPT